MKILLTGSSGMLGGSLLKKLISLNFDVLAPKRGELNLLNQSETFDYVKNCKVDLVLHCAATVGGIKSNIEFPTKYILNNLLIDSNLVNASLQNGVQSFLYMSSSCIYPASNSQPMRTQDLFTGKLESTNQSYAMAKLAGMQLMDSVSSEFNLNYRSVILSNLYGPGDNFNLESSHLIAAAIRKVFDAKKLNHDCVIIMGSGRARREFTYVDDVSDWIVSILARIGELPNQLNLGYGKDFSVDEYYELASDVIGYRGELTHDFEAPEGMYRKLMDSDYAREKFDWQPRVDPKAGISKTFMYWNERGGKHEV